MLNGLKKRAKDAIIKLSDLAEKAVDARMVKKKPAAAAAPAAKPVAKAAAAAPVAAPEAAPVMLYMDWNSRPDLKRITDVLRSAGIEWKELDVTEDESTRAWVKAAAGLDDLPVLFIAGEVIGGVQEVVQADAIGELKKKVFGR